MKKIILSLCSPFKKVLYLGIEGSFERAENRTTLFTNSIVIWGCLVLGPLVVFLKTNGIEFQVYGPSYIVIVCSSFIVLFLNHSKKYIAARALGLLIVNLTGWEAIFIFGKSFNGYYSFFVAIAYSIVAFVKAPVWFRFAAFTLTFVSLPIIDYLDHQQVVPVTRLHSSQFSFSLLVMDTIMFVGMLSIVIFVEKNYSDSQEHKLTKMNNNLEELVEKRTTLLLQSKEKNIQVEILRAQFLANISHELRIPVQGIVGFSQIASRRVKTLIEATDENEKKELEGKLVKNLSSIEESSARLMNLLERLFLLTRKGQDSFHASPHSFDIKEILTELISNTEEFNERKNIHLDFTKIKRTQCYSDSVMVQQALSCLLMNAVQYSPLVSPIEVNVEEAVGRVEVRIINQGKGIKEDEIETIFEAFYQGALSDNGDGGTGLGLTLCRKYMESVQGQVQVVSSSSDQTEFKLTFPSHLRGPSS